MLPIKTTLYSGFPIPKDLPIFTHLKCLALLICWISDTQL